LVKIYPIGVHFAYGIQPTGSGMLAFLEKIAAPRFRGVPLRQKGLEGLQDRLPRTTHSWLRLANEAGQSLFIPNNISLFLYLTP
jgi:hypothetical protein